jgi:hypothetical protein
MRFASLIRQGFVLVLGLTLAVSLVSAKDIKTGGATKGPKPPPTYVELPVISVAMRTEDGGWHHVQITAWLAPKDMETLHALETAKNSIIDRADHDLPTRSYETLKGAETGEAEAKKVIKAASEASLGHAWQGDVLIQKFLVY